MHGRSMKSKPLRSLAAAVKISISHHAVSAVFMPDIPHVFPVRGPQLLTSEPSTSQSAI